MADKELLCSVEYRTNGSPQILNCPVRGRCSILNSSPVKLASHIICSLPATKKTFQDKNIESGIAWHGKQVNQGKRRQCKSQNLK